MNNGVIYLNAGRKMLPRLLVSAHSLQKYYKGPISIISIGQESKSISSIICKNLGINLVEVEQNLTCRHYYWFEKSRIHLYTPYDNSIFIDSDTLIVNNFDELFTEIDKHDFIVPQFSNWISSGPKISKRLKSWNHIDEDLVKRAIGSKMPSVNVGVYGFKKTAEFMQHWFDFTIQNPTAPLPEEASCHLLLQKYKGTIISSKYNCSCKHDDPTTSDTKIIHYHGRKHCLCDENNNPKYNAGYWIKAWKEIFENNICDIKQWYSDCADRSLNNFMRKRYEFFR